jgi:ABC-2 type transport system permease protein
MRGYFAILRGAFMIGLVYRFGFVFTIIGNILYMCVAYFLWRSIYENTTTIHGLTFNETFIYVALGSTVFVLLKTYADWIIAHEIEDGTISIYLTKPVDYQLYALSTSLGAVLTNLAAISIPTLLLLILVFKVTFPLGPGLLLFPVSLLLAFLISVLAGALIPLQFFPDALQKILLLLPFQAIYYTPLMLITRPNQGWDALLFMLAVQAIWVVILYALTRLFYNQAIKVLRVAGG